MLHVIVFCCCIMMLSDCISSSTLIPAEKDHDQSRYCFNPLNAFSADSPPPPISPKPVIPSSVSTSTIVRINLPQCAPFACRIGASSGTATVVTRSRQSASGSLNRINRGPPGVRVIRRKLLVHPTQIEHPVDLPDQMIGWHHLVEIERIEELALPAFLPSHHAPPPMVPNSSKRNHRSPRVSIGVLQHNLG